jgi:hypothetical protein
MLNLKKYKPDELRSDGHQQETLALRPTPPQLILFRVCARESLFFDVVKLQTRVELGPDAPTPSAVPHHTDS